MISAAVLPSSEALDTGEAGADYFATEIHYLSLAGRIVAALRGGGKFFLIVGEPPPSAQLLFRALSKSTASSDAVINLRCGPELTGEEIRRAASVITRLAADGAGQVPERSGLAAPLFVFDDIDRLSDRQIRDIYEAVEHGDRIRAAAMLLARPVFLTRLEEPALRFLKEAVAAQFRFQEVGQDEGIEFLRHQLATRHRTPEIRRAPRVIIWGCAALAGLAAAAIATILVLHPMEPAGEPTAHSAADIASIGQTPAKNEATSAAPAKGAPGAGAAAVLPSTPSLVPTVPSGQVQPDRTRPAAMEPTRPPEESPSPAPAQPVPMPAVSPPSTQQPGEGRLSTAEITALLARGDGFLRAGDIASARLFYERAAAAGDGHAALRLGATLDPGFLGRAGIRGIRGDVDQAASWYRRARELGDPVAENRLKGLQERLAPPGDPAR